MGKAMISGSFYTIGEAAAQLGRHRNTIARWGKEGRLPITRLGNTALTCIQPSSLIEVANCGSCCSSQDPFTKSRREDKGVEVAVGTCVGAWVGAGVGEAVGVR